MRRHLLFLILCIGISSGSWAQKIKNLDFLNMERPSVSLAYNTLPSRYTVLQNSPFVPLKLGGGIDIGVFPLNLRIIEKKEGAFRLVTSLGMSYSHYVFKDESYSRAMHSDGAVYNEIVYNYSKSESKRSMGYCTLRIPVKAVFCPRWSNGYYLGFGQEAQLHFGSYYRVKTPNDVCKTKDIVRNTESWFLALGKDGLCEVFASLSVEEVIFHNADIFKNYGVMADACKEFQLGMKVTIPDINPQMIRRRR